MAHTTAACLKNHLSRLPRAGGARAPRGRALGRRGGGLRDALRRGGAIARGDGGRSASGRSQRGRARGRLGAGVGGGKSYTVSIQ